MTSTNPSMAIFCEAIGIAIVKHLINVKFLHSGVNLSDGYDIGTFQNNEALLSRKTTKFIYFYIIKKKKPEFARRQHTTNTNLPTQSAYPIDPKNIFCRTKKKIISEKNGKQMVSSANNYTTTAAVYANKRSHCIHCGKIYVANAMNFHMVDNSVSEPTIREHFLLLS
jgi:hypothetical protein